MSSSRSHFLQATTMAAAFSLLVAPLPQLDYSWRMVAGVFCTVFLLSLFVLSNSLKWHEGTSLSNAELDAMQNHERAAQMLWSIATKGLIESERRTRLHINILFILIVLMILLSFCLIIGGFWLALSLRDQIEIGKISAISGTVVAFLSGSALVVYKRLMDQSSMHGRILERLNVIAYARDIVGGIKDLDIKDKAKASLSIQMLNGRIEPEIKKTRKTGGLKKAEDSDKSHEEEAR